MRLAWRRPLIPHNSAWTVSSAVLTVVEWMRDMEFEAGTGAMYGNKTVHTPYNLVVVADRLNVGLRWLCVQGCRRNCTRSSRHIRGGSASRTVSSRRSSPRWRRLLRSSPSRRSRSSAISPFVTRYARRPLPVCSGPCAWWSSYGLPRVSPRSRIRYTRAPITTCSIRWPGVRSSTHLSAPYPASGCQIWDTHFRYYDASLNLFWRGTFHTWYGSNDLGLWSLTSNWFTNCEHWSESQFWEF